MLELVQPLALRGEDAMARHAAHKVHGVGPCGAVQRAARGAEDAMQRGHDPRERPVVGQAAGVVRKVAQGAAEDRAAALQLRVVRLL